jgi:DUF4097 and DUF4098 domain-containing protein YvlB
MIPTVSRLLLPAMLISIFHWTGCSDLDRLAGNNNFSAEELFTSDVTVQSQTKLRLEGISGTVTVTGNTGTTLISITAKRRVEAESVDDARECLKLLQINVQDLGNEVFVQTQQPKDTRGRNYIVDYTIVVPQTFRAQVTNVTGAVNVIAVNNAVLVNCVTGSVSLDRVAGDATVSLVTGKIDGKVTMQPNGVVDFSTVTGSISLHIPTATSAQLTASLTTGTIGTSNLVFQSQTSSATSLTGKLGDGKGTITLKTVTGSIDIAGQ